MEIAVILLTIVVIAWITGFLKSARTVADAANASVTSHADKYVRGVLRERVNAQPLTDEELTKAAEDIRRMEEIRSMFR